MTHELQHGCEVSIPVFSTFGKGPKGDSFKIEKVESEDGTKTYIKGLRYDEESKRWIEEWTSENLEAGDLKCKLIMVDGLTPPTFRLRFTYDGEGVTGWSMTTPNIPYFPDFPDTVSGISVAGLAKVVGIPADDMLSIINSDAEGMILGYNDIITAITQVAETAVTTATLGKTVLTPEAFGAVGDGETDDTAAMKAWLAADTTMPKIGSGFYLVSEELVVTNSITISGSIVSVNNGSYVHFAAIVLAGSGMNVKICNLVTKDPIVGFTVKNDVDVTDVTVDCHYVRCHGACFSFLGIDGSNNQFNTFTMNATTLITTEQNGRAIDIETTSGHEVVHRSIKFNANLIYGSVYINNDSAAQHMDVLVSCQSIINNENMPAFYVNNAELYAEGIMEHDVETDLCKAENHSLVTIDCHEFKYSSIRALTNSTITVNGMMVNEADSTLGNRVIATKAVRSASSLETDAYSSIDFLNVLEEKDVSAAVLVEITPENYMFPSVMDGYNGVCRRYFIGNPSFPSSAITFDLGHLRTFKTIGEIVIIPYEENVNQISATIRYRTGLLAEEHSKTITIKDSVVTIGCLNDMSGIYSY